MKMWPKIDVSIWWNFDPISRKTDVKLNRNQNETGENSTGIHRESNLSPQANMNAPPSVQWWQIPPASPGPSIRFFRVGGNGKDLMEIEIDGMETMRMLRHGDGYPSAINSLLFINGNFWNYRQRRLYPSFLKLW